MDSKKQKKDGDKKKKVRDRNITRIEIDALRSMIEKPKPERTGDSGPPEAPDEGDEDKDTKPSIDP